MKKRFFIALAALVMTSVASMAEVVRFGYAPEQCAEEDMIAQGSGTNGFCAGMICLDPNVDPVVKRLEGHSVKGVRAYFLNDYKQSRQSRSKVLYATGTPDNTTKKVCDFVKGWNEIYFDEPVTIGSEPIYVGIQVYELRGTPYPLVTFGKADIAGGCWVNLEDEGWVEYSQRGTLMIQAILDDEAAPKLENMFYASVEKSPLVVAPSEKFDASVYFHNMTNQEVSSITLSTIGQGDTEALIEEVTFDTPLAAHEGRMVQMPIRAGAESGVAQWLKLSVLKMNGVDTQQVMDGVSTHHVTVDAFNRIPMIEEFTSQACSTCPFMIYYLDMAMEEYDGPLVYVTHHSGFQKDRFTKPVDEELLYLFGSKPLQNPAVMYDRWVPEGESSPIFFAQLAEHEPYLEQIMAAAVRPAMASVEFDLRYDENAKTVGCTVSGRVGSSIVSAGIPAYLSVYLVEDNIPLSDDYFQLGLDGDDAPADLKEKFRHNGIKRHDFTLTLGGDLLTTDENGNYSVDYADIAIDPSWNVDNLKLVGYVCKIDKNNIRENGVLNANYKHLTNSSVISVDSDMAQVGFKVTRDRRIVATSEVADFSIFNLQGVAVDKNDALVPGIYIVSFKDADGNVGAKKLLVK